MDTRMAEVKGGQKAKSVRDRKLGRAEDERMQALVPGRVPECPEICQPSRTEGLDTTDLKTIILTCVS